jgi:hypothetical protein
MTKLERQALKYRINLGGDQQPDQPSTTALVAVPFPMRNDTQRQSEYERLKSELQLAKKRLQDFVNQDRQQRRAARHAGAN